MSISRRVAATLSGLVMAGAIASGPALADTQTAVQSTSSASSIATATTNPSDGFCNQDEDGVIKLGGDGHLYQCGYVVGPRLVLAAVLGLHRSPTHLNTAHSLDMRDGHSHSS